MTAQKRSIVEEDVSRKQPKKESSKTPDLSYSKWWKRIETAEKDSKNRDEVIKLYEQYLSIFKNDGKGWAKYINYEMEHPKEKEQLDKKSIETQFSKVLSTISGVDLWLQYVKYVEKINDASGDNAEMARSIVLKAYSFAAEKAGIDYLHSGEFWDAYLGYLNSWKPANANEAMTRTELTRSVMLQMIKTPSIRLEDNWKLYISFETEMDQAKARKNINDQSADFMKLRPLSQELYAITKPLKESNARRHSRRQLANFSRWIAWEKANKLGIPEDKAQERLEYVYRLSTQMQRFQPAVWYNYASYLIGKHKDEEALTIITNGLAVNPDSTGLTYALANYYELQSDKKQMEESWYRLIERKTAEYTANSDDSSRHIVCTCYIMLMRQAKRMGTIKDVRSVFSKARRFAGVNWQVFASYSWLEYQSNETKVAIRSFELGMRHFGKEYAYVSRYLDFLIEVRDMTNCKKVIEIGLENMKDDPIALEKLFRKYLRIELEFGDTSSIRALENRFISKFPDKTPFDLTVMGFESEDGDFNACRVTDEYVEPSKSGEHTSIKQVIAPREEITQIQPIHTITSNPINAPLPPIPGMQMPVEYNTPVQNPTEQIRPFEVRDEVYNLLRILPKADYYEGQPSMFDAKKTVEFFRRI